MHRLMFVCHGNICRSPMAEYIMKDIVSNRGAQSDYYIVSSAVSPEEYGNPVYPQAERKLRERGIPAPPRRATTLRRSDYGEYDLIVCMEAFNIKGALRTLGGDPQGKVVRLLDFTDRPRDISDPWYTGDFDRAFDDIQEGCEALFAKLSTR